MDYQDLLTDLRQLAGTLDAEPGDLAEHLTGLIAALQQAVSGSAGLRLTVVRSGHPVTLTATDAARINRTQSSVAIPLPLLSPGYEPGGRAVFYSTVPGAFVDLAADLAHVLDKTMPPDAAVELDIDLPLRASNSAVTGLDDLATLNRAAGVLLSQGQHPDTVHQVLRSRAAAASMTPLAFAAQLLDRSVPRVAGSTGQVDRQRGTAGPDPRR